MSVASEARREAPAQAELRPSAPGELIQAKRCASLAFRAPISDQACFILELLLVWQIQKIQDIHRFRADGSNCPTFSSQPSTG
jgi:hypothetical protein